MNRIAAFLRERIALGDRPAVMMEGGASFAYAFGTVLVLLLLVEAGTGLALAAFYSPSSTDAWASVAYIQDQTTWGWLVRGLHFHGAGALVVVAGLHLVQTALAGAYKRPRELVWWLGLLLLVLVLTWAVTGYVLRWDQAGYWANRVEIGIAAATPIVGGKIRDVALGGNDYGNLTLTRFYMVHVLLMPAAVGALTWLHVAIAQRHGTTAIGRGPAVPRWPDQRLRDTIVMALVTAILLGYVVSAHGVELAAPADPSQAYDARPLWYFRWLFELRELAGSAEKIAALLAPAVVGGYLVALPLLDRGPDRAVGKRIPWLGGLAGLLAVIGALTVMSLARDSGDSELAKRQDKAQARADRARMLAQQNGVPATGGQDVYDTAPHWRARVIFEAKCKGCHANSDPKKRKAPYIGPGHGNRAWIKGMVLGPSGPLYWGQTEYIKEWLPWANKTDAEKKEAEEKGVKVPPQPMEAVALEGADLDNLAEAMYALNGAPTCATPPSGDCVDAKRVEAGMKIYENACDSCHTLAPGASANNPNLDGLGSRAFYRSFLSNPKAANHMGTDRGKMPRFDDQLSLSDRDALAAYLVWLRTATDADLAALGPPELP